MIDRASKRWSLHPALLVRMSGFALERLDLLCLKGSTTLDRAVEEARSSRIRAGVAADEQLGRERYQGHPAFDDPQRRKLLSRHVKAIRRFAREGGALPEEALSAVREIFPASAESLDQLHRTQSALQDAERRYEDTFAAELAAERAALRCLYRDDARLREAVLMESAEAHRRITQLLEAGDGARNVRARQRERLAILYAQRFFAKNDSNSICGPHGIAFLSQEYGGPFELRIEKEIEVREAFFSQWGAELLYEALAPRQLRLLANNPTLVLDGDRATWASFEHDAMTTFRRRYSRARLDELSREVLGVLSAPRTLSQLVAALGDVDPADVEQCVAGLIEAGVIDGRAKLPAGSWNPLGDLRAILRSLEVEALDDEVRRFARAGLDDRVSLLAQIEQRFERVTGASATRGAGQHYADRSLLHEDCHTRFSLRLGSQVIDPLMAAVGPLLSAAALPIERSRELTRVWFAERFGSARVPALEVHRAFDEDDVLSRPVTSENGRAIELAMQRVRDLLGAAVSAAGGGVARVAPAALFEAALSPGQERAAYASLDLMFAARPSEPPLLVMGEVHAFFFLPTCLLGVVPEKDHVIEGMRADLTALAAGHTTAESLLLHTQATDRRLPIAELDLEVAGRGKGRRAVSFGALSMVLVDGEIRFFHGDEEIVPISAYTTYPFLAYTSPLAPLIDRFAAPFFPEVLLPDALKADAPRVLVGDLVFRRATRAFGVEELRSKLDSSSESALFSSARKLRDSIRFGRRVFARVPPEPKPLYLDFESFLLIEAFAKWLEHAPSSGVVKISEMLPGADELFLAAPDGKRTFELRLGVMRAASES